MDNQIKFSLKSCCALMTSANGNNLDFAYVASVIEMLTLKKRAMPQMFQDQQLSG
jgi:hypothetical protein